MPPPWVQILTFLAIAVATVLVVRIWIQISLRAKILDVPTHRSSHVRVTPRGGGIGIVTGVLGGIGAVALVTGADQTTTAWFCVLSTVVAGVSLVDDVRSLPSLIRLALHLGAAITAVEIFGAFATIFVPLAGDWSGPPWLMYAVTIFWIVGVTNVYNFMDGIDGIAGGQGVVAGLAWAAWGTHSGNAMVSWLGLALTASCTGFLVLNWSPARVFMGDVGSAFLGFAFGVIPLLALRAAAVGDSPPPSHAGVIPVFAALVVWPFLADGIYTFARRLKNRENVLAAHRSHLYQRLTIAGWSHASVAGLYIAWAVLACVLGAAVLSGGAAGGVAAVTVALITILALRVFVGRQERAPTA